MTPLTAARFIEDATTEVDNICRQMRRVTDSDPSAAVICACGLLIVEKFREIYGRDKARALERKLLMLVHHELLGDKLN